MVSLQRFSFHRSIHYNANSWPENQASQKAHECDQWDRLTVALEILHEKAGFVVGRG